MDMLMKPRLCVNSQNATDDCLQYLRQMNITHCFVMFSNEHSNYEDVSRIPTPGIDMTKVMRVLVEEKYDQAIYVDHIFRTEEATGGDLAAFAYATGYMKGLMHMAYSDLA